MRHGSTGAICMGLVLAMYPKVGVSGRRSQTSVTQGAAYRLPNTHMT